MAMEELGLEPLIFISREGYCLTGYVHLGNCHYEFLHSP